MNEIFLDANILMEILFQRSKYSQIKDIFGNYSNFYISFLTVHILMYYTEIEKLEPANTWKLLENLTILENNQNTFDFAKKIYDGKDFEDCLQVATCLNNNTKNFLTLDKNLAKKHSDKLNIILL